MMIALQDLWYDFIDWAAWKRDVIVDYILMWWDWHWGVYSCRPEDELHYRWNQLSSFTQSFYRDEDDYVTWNSYPRWKKWAVWIGCFLFVFIGSIDDINF